MFATKTDDLVSWN